MKTATLKVAAVFLAATSLNLPNAVAQKRNSDIENIGTRDINGGLNLFVPDAETESNLGRQVAADLESRTTLLADGDVVDYVNRVAQKIVRNSDARASFAVKVIDSDTVNAFALPAGFLYLTKGLILAAEDEAELAGLLAHHVAHIAARHTMETQGKAQLVNIATIPASIFLGGIPAAIVQESLSTGVPVSFVAFSRAAEEEADFLGLQYMAKAGYEPAAMLRFFDRLQAQEIRAKISPLFSTHPLTPERVRTAEQDMANFPAIPSEFDTVRTRLRETDR
jgi:predicted Zn-dependent protease